jgi:hypothetical protein
MIKSVSPNYCIVHSRIGPSTMKFLRLSVVLVILASTVSEGGVANTQKDPKQDDFLYGVFPSYFKWGFATAAYQIEGGWNASGETDRNREFVNSKQHGISGIQYVRTSSN